MPAVILQEFHEQPRSDQPQPPALSESSNAAATRNSSTTRRHTSHSSFARSALMNQRNSSISTSTAAEIPSDRLPTSQPRDQQPAVKFAQPNYSANGATAVDGSNELRPQPRYVNGRRFSKDGVGPALTDTPLPSRPNSPRIHPVRQNSASSTPRIRPTTLDIPGLTKSKVSPDGKIAQRDVGSKLVIVMVGLPARGKSYITKKTARYLNWLQHDTKIFNVGERRRVAASAYTDTSHAADAPPPERVAAEMMLNGTPPAEQRRSVPRLNLPEPAAANEYFNETQSSKNENLAMQPPPPPSPRPAPKANADVPALPLLEDPPAIKEDDGHADKQAGKGVDQSASFFDPSNKLAAQIREQAAMDTLDEMLDYILNQGGSVGIFDATNSTLERRKWVMNAIRKKAGPAINVLFIESVCTNEAILESNMRLKLSGPDYKNVDPNVALEDFKKRVKMYEKDYVPLGDYEEDLGMPYVKLIDVGRKVISHKINGFIAAQAVYYLLNFNLAPRQIWITRHGESVDNRKGRIGGDSDLTENGRRYGDALARFLDHERKDWEERQAEKAANTHFPPRAGDHTPPNPHYALDGEAPEPKNFCVWTSMLKRSIQTAEPFEREPYGDVYELKQMRMLNELYAGEMEGMTYDDIKNNHAEQFELRQRDKMQYRYPGPGGEGYLDVINRLRPVIVELERMTDHCLLVCHRSVARVLLAYFMGLKRDDVADLDCPLGMLYMLEPKPYGVEFKAYKYDADRDWFFEPENYELHRSDTMH